MTDSSLPVSYDDFKQELIHSNQLQCSSDVDSLRALAKQVEHDVEETKKKQQTLELQRLKTQALAFEHELQRRNTYAQSIQKIWRGARARFHFWDTKDAATTVRIWWNYQKRKKTLLVLNAEETSPISLDSQESILSPDVPEVTSSSSSSHSVVAAIDPPDSETNTTISDDKTSLLSIPAHDIDHGFEIRVCCARRLGRETQLSKHRIWAQMWLYRDHVKVWQDQTSAILVSPNTCPRWRNVFVHKVPELERLELWRWELKIVLRQELGDQEDGFLGQIDVPVELVDSSLAQGRVLQQWFPLGKRSLRDAVSGEVKVYCRYIYAQREEDRDPAQALKKVKPPKRAPVRTNKAVSSATPESISSSVTTKQRLPAVPPKPYLKRSGKHPVKFQKLDWSKVGPRTDSNRQSAHGRPLSHGRPLRLNEGRTTKALTQESSCESRQQPREDERHEDQDLDEMNWEKHPWCLNQLRNAVASMCGSKVPQLAQMKYNTEMANMFSEKIHRTSQASNIPKLRYPSDFLKMKLKGPAYAVSHVIHALSVVCIDVDYSLNRNRRCMMSSRRSMYNLSVRSRIQITCFHPYLT